MRSRITESYTPEVELPITPMLDMAFQLLMFFVMTYNPSNLERHMPLDLTAAEEAGTDLDRRTESPEATPDESEEKPLVIVLARHGSDGRLESVKVLTLGTDGETATERGTFHALADLRKQLEAIHAELKSAGRDDERLALRASDRLRWENTMQVMDVCRQTPDGEPLFPRIELAPLSELSP